MRYNKTTTKNDDTQQSVITDLLTGQTIQETTIEAYSDDSSDVTVSYNVVNAGLSQQDTLRYENITYDVENTDLETYDRLRYHHENVLYVNGDKRYTEFFDEENNKNTSHGNRRIDVVHVGDSNDELISLKEYINDVLVRDENLIRNTVKIDWQNYTELVVTYKGIA